MKIIIFAFLTLYSLSLSYHDPTVVYVGDRSDLSDLNQQKIPSSQCSQKQLSNQVKDPQALHALKLIHAKEYEDDSQWKTAQSSSEIYPRQWQTNYTITFNTSCTKNPATLKLTSTGKFEVYVNDQLVQDKHNPWPKITKINLNMKCGENNIKIVVFNKDPSPAAIIYAITQNTSQCFKCKFAQLFNNQTCRCECPKQHKCLANQVFNNQQCRCVSQCNKTDQCPREKIWDAIACQCQCQNKQGKCQGNAKWDANTCQCKCVDKVNCIEGFLWDDKLCKCVSSQSEKTGHKSSEKLTTEYAKAHQLLDQPAQD